jgi:hypothetical protein
MGVLRPPLLFANVNPDLLASSVDCGLHIIENAIVGGRVVQAGKATLERPARQPRATAR